ncbi:unnamed protein product [Fraxinus pennsylvanica]|uniref:GRAM domain-containing protein n=1 Tax=Fraxinus pennsylvanica TaxID=56036 RepID=A0AAD1YQX2_9LAMI|nr:unnamed protein product [Fraxinus pennsylvanica]
MVCEFAVRLGTKFSETVKGKLTVGAKIIKKGGRENIFKDIFCVINGEKLLKASQSYLSTSAGPIAGILFISTEKVAFCSEDPLLSNPLLKPLSKLFTSEAGPKFFETVKGKLSVGAKIIKKGGRENIFKDIFGVVNGEKLLKASQCYLSTSAGPIAGILFISTEKIAFCSEDPLLSNPLLEPLSKLFTRFLFP